LMEVYHSDAMMKLIIRGAGIVNNLESL
jgi:hypothetical protein